MTKRPALQAAAANNSALLRGKARAGGIAGMPESPATGRKFTPYCNAAETVAVAATHWEQPAMPAHNQVGFAFVGASLVLLLVAIVL